MLCEFDFDLFSNQVIRNRVFVESIAHQVIVTNLWRKPDGRLISMGGKRLHECLFFLLIGRKTAARSGLLKGTPIQFFQLFLHSCLCFSDGEKLPVTQSCSNPGRNKTDRTLNSSLVIRFPNTRWDNCRAVVFSHLLITLIQDSFISVVRRGCRLAVIGNQQPGNAAKIVVGMNMAQQPILHLHVIAGFGVGIPAAGQNGNEDVDRRELTGYRIRYIQRISGPVYLHSVSRLVRNPHGSLC